MEVKVYQLISTISQIRIVVRSLNTKIDQHHCQVEYGMRKTKGNRIFGIEIREILAVEYDTDLSPLFLHGPSWWTTIHYKKKVFALLWFPFQLALELNDAHLHYINICSHSYIRWNMVEEIRILLLGNLVRLSRRPYNEYWLHIVYMTSFGERKASMHNIFLADVRPGRCSKTEPKIWPSATKDFILVFMQPPSINGPTQHISCLLSCLSFPFLSFSLHLSTLPSNSLPFISLSFTSPLLLITSFS